MNYKNILAARAGMNKAHDIAREFPRSRLKKVPSNTTKEKDLLTSTERETLEPAE